jgi:putative PIN family toxin of toxin-antitoxin system
VNPQVVFDVNILVSAIIAPSGTPAAAYREALEQNWDIVRSPHIIDKLLEVLDRPRFYGRLPSTSLSAFLDGYQAFSKPVTPDPTVRGVAPDLEDDPVLGTAVAANADFLVTGDKGLLAIGEYRGVKIITPGDFLQELASV